MADSQTITYSGVVKDFYNNVLYPRLTDECTNNSTNGQGSGTTVKNFHALKILLE